MAKLKNKKHELFCQEYLIDLNGTQAYLRTGYKVSNEVAKINACRLLTNANVQERIAELMDGRSKRTEITADKVLEEIAHIAFDDISNYLSFKMNEDKEISVTIKDSETIDTRNVSEISTGKDGQFKFKLYCRDNALVQLGRHLGMFTDKVEITKPTGEIIEQIESYVNGNDQ